MPRGMDGLVALKGAEGFLKEALEKRCERKCVRAETRGVVWGLPWFGLWPESKMIYIDFWNLGRNVIRSLTEEIGRELSCFRRRHPSESKRALGGTRNPMKIYHFGSAFVFGELFREQNWWKQQPWMHQGSLGWPVTPLGSKIDVFGVSLGSI